jgi:chemotaxis protein CheX
MDVNYINGIIEAFTVTLGQFGVSNIKRCNIQKKNKMYLNLDLSTIVCFQGAVQGDIALSMPLDTAKKLASIMMMGMNITSIDDMPNFLLLDYQQRLILPELFWNVLKSTVMRL